MYAITKLQNINQKLTDKEGNRQFYNCHKKFKFYVVIDKLTRTYPYTQMI